MANLLEYTLSLNDKISSKLQKIGVNSNYALDRFAALERKTRELNTATKSMGTTLGTLREKLALLKAEREWIPANQLGTIRAYNREIKKLTKQIDKLETINGSRFKTWLSKAKESIPGILMNPFTIAGVMGGKAIKAGIENEMQTTSFSVLLKSETAAKKLVADLQRYAIASGYGQGMLSKAMQTMLGFGVAKEKALPVLKAIGDIAMGDAQKFQSLTLAFSQMRSTGRLMGQDLLQMINAGFNPLKVISQQTGESIAVLKKKMERGAISAQTVENAFLAAASKGGLYYGMMQKINQTPMGQFRKMMGMLQIAGIKLYQILSPIVRVVMKLGVVVAGLLAKGLGYLAKQIQIVKPLILGLSTYLLVAKIRMMSVWLWSKITTLSLKIQSLSWKMLTNVIKSNPIGFILSLLTMAIVYLTDKTVGWGKAFKKVWEGVKWGFMAFVYHFKAQIQTLVQGFAIALDKLMIGYYRFRNFVHLGSKDENNAQLARLRQDVERRKKIIVGAHTKTLEALKKSGQAFSGAFGSIKWKTSGAEATAQTGALSPEGMLSGNSMTAGTQGEGYKAGQNITTGGRSIKRIEISLGNLIEKLIIQPAHLEQGVDEMEEQVKAAMLRILATASNI